MLARRLPHEPALDGLRGAALVLVLGFHAEVPGFSGGFLGVSLFFTLSGYLITQLLVREHATTGRIALGGFWRRRVRRLAPASLAGLLGVAIVAATTSAFPGSGVPGDVLASLANVANWRFAFADVSYAELFTSGPSPVLHFWSLAIEEQFYVVLPLLTAVALRWGRRALVGSLAALAVAGTAASVVAGTDLAYYGTHARAPELLVGSLLGLAFPIGRPVRAGRDRWIAGAALVAAAGVGVVVVSTTVDSGWLYDGGLPAFSLLSATVIAGATVAGPLSRVGRLRPLVEVGRYSYGAYVYHWPLFLILTEERTGLDGAALVVVRLAATAALALASGRLLEEPIRRGIGLRGRVGGAALAGGALSVALLATLAPASTEPAFETTAADHLTVDRPAVVDVAVVGSSTLVETWVRLAEPAGFELRISSHLQPGCPAVVPDGPSPGCRPFRELVAPLRADPPDVVVMALGAEERAPLVPLLTPTTTPEEGIAVGDQAFKLARSLLEERLDLLPEVPVLLVDLAPDRFLSTVAADTTLVTDRLWTSEAADRGAFTADLVEVLRDLDPDDRVAVMVIGDSSSMQLALALDAAGRDRLEVIWAGQASCPIAPADSLRWGAGLDLDTTDCPSTDRRWPEVVADLRPQIVLIGSSLGSLSEHRYPGAADWAVPGDPAYVVAHDAAMADLQALLAPVGAVTLVATTPPVLRGQAYDGPVGEPARLQAWLAQIARWDEAWRSVAVLDWAALVAEAEAGAVGSLHDDAVHLKREPLLEVLGPRLVEELVSASASLEADASGSGCLAGEGDERRLVLDRCAAAAPETAPTG